MTRTISAYDAPALIDAHASMTRLSLYEAMQSPSGEAASPGLSAAIADNVVAFVCSANGWAKPIRRDMRFEIEGSDLGGYARHWETADDKGPLSVVFHHVAAYVFSTRWRRSGMAPDQYAMQAQWTMLGTGWSRVAIVALADKTPEIFWVDRDEGMVSRMAEGARDLSLRIARKDPPPVDSAAELPTPPAADRPESSVPTDPNLAQNRLRECREVLASAKNDVQFAESHLKNAEKAMLAALAPGGSNEHDGYRITRNAKTDALTEEKIDAQYF